MSIPYVAVGVNELGQLLGVEAECPGCGKLHAVRSASKSVEMIDGTYREISVDPSDTIQFVRCPETKKAYMVGFLNRAIKTFVKVREASTKEPDVGD